MDVPREGATYTFERTFTNGDVRQFAEVSRDEQARHTDPDAEGRLMVHGLLTATMPTKVGGDFDVLARRMTFEFHRPVYTGQPITCRSTFDTVDELEDRYDLEIHVDCENDGDDVVMTATIEGLVWKDS